MSLYLTARRFPLRIVHLYHTIPFITIVCTFISQYFFSELGKKMATLRDINSKLQEKILDCEIYILISNIGTYICISTNYLVIYFCLFFYPIIEKSFLICMHVD